MRSAKLLERLHEEVLVGDGALGTLISERGLGQESSYERLNLTHPDFIRRLHAEYLEAGAQVLETNTFGANRTKLDAGSGGDVAAINRAGVALAREAAGDRAFVIGAVGPLANRQGPCEWHALTETDIREIFREQIEALAEAGVDGLVLETFTDLPQILLALETAKKTADLPVICQMAFHERGHTLSGVHASIAAEVLTKAGADVVGANCGRGVRCVRAAIEAMTGGDWLLSAYPNAGLPEYVDGRYWFGAPLPYLTESALHLAQIGTNLIGGCCGTTPEYIRRIAPLLRGKRPAPRVRPRIEVKPVAVIETPLADNAPPPGSILDGFERNANGARTRPLIIVELDPPRDLRYEPIVKRAQQLRDMGVDAITMADNPVATLHMGNLALAQIIQQDADIPVIVHLTCRDHNLLGLQSILMAAHVMGLHHLLALTGDPARVGDQPGATSVYDLNSFGLLELIRSFNSGNTHSGNALKGRTRFAVGAAFNPTARNLPGQVTRLKKKIACGAHFAMTQPIYDRERFDQMLAATAGIEIPLFSGIMPLLSERNAEFLHNEVPGICLTDEVRARMKGFSGKEGRRMGNQICKEMIDYMLPKADGFYLVPPQKFTEMAVELVDHIHQRVPQHALR